MFAISACSSESADDGRVRLELWKHQAGDAEEPANEALFERFNASQDRWVIDAQSIPQASYSDAITVAALAGDMPCIMTVDHPKVPSFAWAGFIQPIDDLVSAETFEGLGPAASGVYQGKTYSVGQFDAALALFARRSALEKVGARIPSIDQPWTLTEFDQVLADIQATGDFRYVMDLGARDVNPDWWAYAMSPMLQSFGGDLIDRTSYETAEGTLNGAQAIAFADWFQSLFEKGYVNKREPDDRGFHKGRNAMTYTGNWWVQAFTDIWGDDLLILPPPDFGNGPVIGGGSWQWAIGADCAEAEGAAAFIDFLMTAEEIAAMSEAASMIPVTEEAALLTENFRPGGEWRVFFDLMQNYARPRPASPAFVTIANAFTRAMRDIMDGKDVRDALDDAVDDIDTRIRENDGYGLQDQTGRAS